MGHLTDTGFQMALDLGSELRRRYINQHRLLPSRQLDANLLHAESTAVQRTVTTLRAVLTGLYPNASAEVRVAVRPYSQELMTADWEGCPALANLTTQLTNLQAARGARRALAAVAGLGWGGVVRMRVGAAGYAAAALLLL